MTLDRLRIDDGRHLVRLVIDEDATHAAREPRYRVACSCGRMPAFAPASRDDALAAHLGHVGVYLGPPKGPRWMPVGARLVLLVLAMLVIAVGFYLSGLAVVDQYALVDTPAALIRGASMLTGFTFAFALMVAVRRYIAPTRA
ncbi:hypothetical protein [Streptomyces pseudogriseolus]|uniref:hypothetical protein n=1 Tax=Streptomyces pseudogriseolus TaxID=36817 RepID=UPI003FA29F88